MNDETTRLINEFPTSKPAFNKQTSNPHNESPNMKKPSKKYAAGAAGFVAGVATGAAATAAATNYANAKETVAPEVAPENETQEENPISSQEEQTPTQENIESPAPEQVILANDEGIRYAHVDAVNFNEAFSQARQQVGPGGVFEYDGKLYGTYYANEWNQMTAQERADYQSRVNEVAPSHRSAPAASQYAEQHHAAAPEVVPADMEMIAAEPVDNEIRVLGVEAVQNPDGQIMNVALVESEGDHALLVDVDNNGVIDVLLHDDNHDGYLQESEMHDISDAGIEVADLLQAQAATEGDSLYASMDNMPDYVNDADSIMSI